jgi:pilus assembly protein Flp/PilA
MAALAVPAIENASIRRDLTMDRIAKLISNERGATAVEYAAIASLISIAAITAMGALGLSVTSLFLKVPSF